MIHDIIGHISFGISAASFMMRKILYLRILAIISLLFGLYYNYFLPTGPLWVVLFWLCIFLIINFYQSGRLIFDNMEYQLSEEEKELQARIFPNMRSRDFKRLLDLATIRKIQSTDIVVEKGGFMNEIILIVSGELIEKENEYKTSIIRRGQVIGESTFVLQDNYGGSPSTIYSKGETTLYSWKYEDLRKLLEKSSEMNRTFLDGIVRGIIKKRGLLLPISGYSEGISEVLLSEDERLIHALGFPRMTTQDLSSILKNGIIINFKEGEEVNKENSVGMIMNGTIRVDRDDGQHIRLTQGNFVGEVGWTSGGRLIKTKSILISEGNLKIIFWDYEKLSLLQNTNPGLFAEFVYHIARDMGIKLTYPLTEGNIYDFSKKIC